MRVLCLFLTFLLFEGAISQIATAQAVGALVPSVSNSTVPDASQDNFSVLTRNVTTVTPEGGNSTVQQPAESDNLLMSRLKGWQTQVFNLIQANVPQSRELQDEIMSNIQANFGTISMDPKDGIADYDRFVFATAKVLRLFNGFMVFLNLIVDKFRGNVLGGMISHLQQHALSTNRLCQSIHRSIDFEVPIDEEDRYTCEKLLQEGDLDLCAEANKLSWSEKEWRICIDRPSLFEDRVQDLQFFRTRELGSSGLINSFSFLFMEWLTDARDAMLQAKIPCWDRDRSSIRKLKFAYFFQLAMTVPRCPNSGDKQTGYAEYVDNMTNVKYTCFPGYQLVGPEKREITQIDQSSMSLEDTMPDCVPIQGATIPEPTKYQADLPEGPVKLNAYKAGYIVSAIVVLMLVFLYMKHQSVNRNQSKEDYEKYKHSLLLTKQTAYLQKEPTLKESYLYFTSFPWLHSGTALRFGIEERFLSPEINQNLRREKLLQSVMVFISIYILIVSVYTTLKLKVGVAADVMSVMRFLV